MIGMTPAPYGEVDELLEPVRLWPERTMLPPSQRRNARQPSLPTSDRRTLVRNTTTNPCRAINGSHAPTFTHNQHATCTNTLTRPHPFRNAVRRSQDHAGSGIMRASRDAAALPAYRRLATGTSRT